MEHVLLKITKLLHIGVRKLQYNKYTDKEIKELLKSMIILIDTREQVTDHITNYFKDKGINYITKKLDHGDYSCMIPKNELLGIHRDMYFTDTLSIERKGSLEELSGNFTKDRSRIESEFIRSRGKMLLLIEGCSYEDIILHNYKTDYKPLSFIATLKSFEARYGIETNFIRKAFSGNFIYLTLKYHVREVLKNGSLRQAM